MSEEKKDKNPRKTAKVALETAKTNLKTFMKANKLKEDSEPTDKKVKKEWAGLQAEVKTAKEALKALKGSSGRRTTYEYPKDMTDPKDRKRYRAKMRAEAKKGEKAAKKADKAEKPAKTEKSDKKEKKAKKED